MSDLKNIINDLEEAFYEFCDDKMDQTQFIPIMANLIQELKKEAAARG